MKCDFAVGDPVVCVHEVNAGSAALWIGQFGIICPIVDEIYHIATIGHSTFCDAIIVTVKEIAQPSGLTVEFEHWMFRKLITPEQFMTKKVEELV